MSSPNATAQVPVVSRPTSNETRVWSEPLSTPGYIPQHLKRVATSQYPIVEILQRLLYRLQPNSDLEKVLALVALYNAVQPVYRHIKDFFFWAFTVDLAIPERDPVAKEVMGWISSEILTKHHTRTAMLTTGALYDPIEDTQSRIYGPLNFSNAITLEDEVQNLRPPIGKRIFWVGYRPFLFSRPAGDASHRNVVSGEIVTGQVELQNALTITTLGWNMKPLRDFATMCHKHKLENVTGMTTMFFADSSYIHFPDDTWASVSKPVRRLDTIDMDEKIKTEIVKDAEYYYSAQSRRFFADCGIPNRRGYLLHGPPGTGKTSFSAALAGHLQCDMYLLNLSSFDMNDHRLHRLFLGLPRKCIVVIEDVDSAGINRENPSDLDLRASNSEHHLHGRKTKHSLVTLSGLLNVIDGNASHEGRLLIMTSNCPDTLDPALLRPGRIDKKIYFGKMSKAAAKSIFLRLIGRGAIAHDVAFTASEIEQCATEFAEKIPPNMFTPAQVQVFLHGCHGDPVKALQDTDAWIQEQLEQEMDKENELAVLVEKESKK